MHADRVDGKSKKRWRRGGAGGAIAVGLCALAGATALIAPPAASAMTSEQLSAICASVFAEIGDPSICAENFLASSGPGGSIAIDLPDGSILVLDSKPDLNRVRCGSGIDARRLADCPKKPQGHTGTEFLTGGKESPIREWVVSHSPAGLRAALRVCAVSRETLAEANNALDNLRTLAADSDAWGPRGNLLDPAASLRLRKEYLESFKWFSREAGDAIKQRLLALRSNTDRDVLETMRILWELTRSEVKKELNSRPCKVARKTES